MKKKMLLLTTILSLSLSFTFLRIQSAEVIDEKIVFTSERDGNSEIYIMNTDGSNQTRLTNNLATDGYPSFSPDGSKIAFTSGRDGNSEIYVMNTDGSNQTRLTNNPATDGYPSFSPDGSKIAFDSGRDGNSEIYIMNVDGSNQTRLTNTLSTDLYPKFSPDGSKIVFTSHNGDSYEIYVINADGSNAMNLTNNPAHDINPSFSPDGSKIVFSSHRDGDEEIYVMNADGSNQTRLTNSPATDWYPSFNPDGSLIVFSSRRDGNHEIYIMNSNGSNQTRLTNNPANDWFPSWSKQGITPPSSYSISGRIHEGDISNGIAGVTVTIGETASPVTTDSEGNFNFSNLPNGNYTITPSQPGRIFTPFNQSVTVNGANLTGINFQRDPCTFSISPTSTSIHSGGGMGSFFLTASEPTCTWTAISSASWITINGSSSGAGNTTINFLVQGSYVPARSGTITVGGQTFTINQDNGCELSLFPVDSNVSNDSGTASFTVNSGTGCGWTATSNVDWITITNGNTGTGVGTVTYNFQTNTGAARTGTITVNNKTFHVNQGCTYSLSPTIVNFAASGGTGSFNVNTQAGCTWTAESRNSSASISGGWSGTGNGQVQFFVQPNTGSARTLLIFVEGQFFNIIQESGCSYSLSSTSSNIAADGGSGSVNVSSGEGCTWTATTNVNWITITSGSSGTGNGTVTYNFQANNGPPRSGTITINDKTFTVNQASGCAYSISPVSANLGASSGTGNFNVTTSAGCAWTATSDVNWITINSVNTGNGNGTVSFAVQGNTGPERSGTITVADKTFTINQTAGCTISLFPTNVTLIATAGGGNVFVTTENGCSWNAVSNVDWITITSGAQGTGNGVVQYTIAEHSGSPRTGTITIGGQIFTINHIPSSPCTYTLSSTSANFSATGGNGSFSVTDYEGCAWTATSNVNWITINSGTGSGTGQITFTVQPNTLTVERTGTISVAGKTFAVVQAAFVANRPPMFDFDGDKKTDLAVFRPTEETWYILRSERGLQRIRFFIGTPTDKIVPADYDGDGKTDHAWIRANIWYVFQSSTLQIVEFPAFGQAGDLPVPGDWDGDGKADQAVYRMGANTGEQSYFYFRGSLNNPNGNITFIPFGQNGDIPVIGDYDGDGKQDAVIFRPTVGEWWYLRSSDGTNRAFQFGQNGDKPLSGDFTGDGKTDIAIFRPTTGEWFVLRSEDGSYYAAPFGTVGDVPVVGDYDGDGRDDIAVWRPSEGNWYVVKSSGGFLIAPFGSAGDKPIPSAFVP